MTDKIYQRGTILHTSAYLSAAKRLEIEVFDEAGAEAFIRFKCREKDNVMIPVKDWAFVSEQVGILIGKNRLIK